MAVIVGTKTTLAYIAESTRGTTPASPNLTVLRGIGRNVNLKKDSLESAEVSASRQRRDVRHGFQRGEGDIQFELAMESYNDMLLWGLGGASWFTPTTCPNTATLSVTLNSPSAGLATITRTAGSFDFLDAGYRVGDYVTTASFSAGGNNGQQRLLIVNQSAVVVPLGTLVTDAGSATGTITYVGKKCIIGTDLKTMTLEREFADAVNPVYEVYRGMAINTMNFAARPEGLVLMTLGMLAMSGDIDNTASIDTNAVYTAAPLSGQGSPPFSGIDTAVFIGAFQINATSFDFTVDNQRSLQGALGFSTSRDVYEGVAKVTGRWTQTIQNNSLLASFQNELTSTLAMRMSEVGSSDFMGISFYKVKSLSHDMDPPASGPVLQEMSFEALETSLAGTAATYREVMHIQRSTST